MAATWPLLISRYTVMFETRIVPATSPTVSRRSPTNRRRLPICHILHMFNGCHSCNTCHISLMPPSCCRGARTVTAATILVKHLACLLSALGGEFHKWDSRFLRRNDWCIARTGDHEV